MRRWLLRWFPLATRAGRAFGERFTLLGKWMCATCAIAGIFSADPSRTHAFIVFTATAALLVIAFVSSLVWRPRVTARRRLPACATQGQRAIYSVELHNAGRRRLPAFLVADRLRLRYPTREEFAAEVADAPEDNWFDRQVGFLRWQRLRQRLQGATLATTPVTGLAAGETLSVELEVTPLRRGWLQFDALRLLQPDPLGLCYAVLTLPLPDRLLCRPASVTMPAFDVPRPRAQARAHEHVQQRGQGLEFFALRDYRPGDPLKHVDWRASARRGQPVVRQFAIDARQPPLIAVDCAAARRAHADFEAMVSVAASLAVAMFGRGDAALALLADDGASCSTLSDALDALAVLAPTPGDTLPAWHRLLAAASEVPVVIVCARWDAPRAAALNDATTSHAILVLCTDPDAVIGAPQVLAIAAPSVELPPLAWPRVSSAHAS